MNLLIYKANQSVLPVNVPDKESVAAAEEQKALKTS